MMNDDSPRPRHLTKPEKSESRHKFQPGSRVIGRDEGGKGSFRDRRGVVLDRHAETGEYRVQFDDDGAIEYVSPSWIEAEE